MPRYPWFRVYNEILTERKIERVGRMTHLPRVVIRGAWMTLLAMANDSPNRGYLMWTDDLAITEQEIADDLEMDLDEFSTLLDAFVKMQMVTRNGDGLLSCTNWDKRQFLSDHSTPRVKRYRDQQKKQRQETSTCNVSRTLHSNGPDTDTDTDTETETDTQQHPPVAQPVDNSNGDGVVVALRDELLAWKMLLPQAEQCVKERTPADIRAFLNYVENNKDDIRNPAGFLYDALVKKPQPPPKARDSPKEESADDRRRRYGRYAVNVKEEP